MIKDKCNHEWRFFKNATGDIPAKYECLKCKMWLTAPDVYQLESLDHLKGFEKYMNVFAIIISVIALLISIFK
jgi:hypothetical protein